jgi:hypothetical protein
MLTQSLKAQNAWKCLILEVHMLQDIMYVVFFFFTHKQSYSGNHFTGGSNTVGIVIKIISVLNMILEIAYLIRFAIRISILHAIILFVTAIVITLFVNGLICKQTISLIIIIVYIVRMTGYEPAVLTYGFLNLLDVYFYGYILN